MTGQLAFICLIFLFFCFSDFLDDYSSGAIVFNIEDKFDTVGA